MGPYREFYRAGRLGGQSRFAPDIANAGKCTALPMGAWKKWRARARYPVELGDPRFVPGGGIKTINNPKSRTQTGEFHVWERAAGTDGVSNSRTWGLIRGPSGCPSARRPRRSCSSWRGPRGLGYLWKDGSRTSRRSFQG